MAMFQVMNRFGSPCRVGTRFALFRPIHRQASIAQFRSELRHFQLFKRHVRNN